MSTSIPSCALTVKA